MSLSGRIPDSEVLLSLAPEESALQLLAVLGDRTQHQSGLVHRDEVSRLAHEYLPRDQNDVELAVNEAWRWLELNLFILPAAGTNGNNGWFVLGRRAKTALERPDYFTSYTHAAKFSRDFLHPAIAERVWTALSRGDYADAVFYAFRSVEEAVRKAGSYPQSEVGVVLMRKAFDSTRGPLTKMTDPESERVALAHLFAGAIGSYKNPHSHRTVTLDDASEAQEMVMLASHLLRIVDARTPT